jgi:hypothetical protein
MSDKKNGPQKTTTAAQPSSGAAPAKSSKGSGISKMEGVRRVLAKLGKDTKPLQIKDYLKRHYGIDMNISHISNYKSEILGKAKAKPVAAKKAPAAAPAATAAPVSRPHAAKSSAEVSLADIRTVKELVGRVGAESLRSLIDMLAK